MTTFSSRKESSLTKGIGEVRYFLSNISPIISRAREHEGIVFKARTLRDRGKGAAEKEFGADFCGVLNIDFKGFVQRKGFLSQAKREGYGITARRTRYGVMAVHFDQNEEFKRLKGQTNDMLSITPDSFVFVYGQGGFLVVPASSVKGLKRGAKLYAKRVDRFFKEYLMCFIGDHRLKAWNDNSLRSLREKTNSRTAIMFQIKKTEGGLVFS